MRRIIPSIASADQLRLAQELARVDFLPDLHLDIEDGNFLPNITFGIKTVRSIAKEWCGSLDVHLLVTNPGLYIDDLVACGVSAVSFHVEATPYPLELLCHIKSHGLRAGIAINPATPLNRATYCLGHVDYLLLMCSEPDGRGQVFLPDMPKRIRVASCLLPVSKELWVDGGIGRAEAAVVCDNGADVVIMGRAVFGAANSRSFVETVMEEINSRGSTRSYD